LKDLTDEPFRALKQEGDQSLARRCGISREELRPWHYQDPFFQEAPRTDDIDFDTYYRDRDVVTLVADFFEGIGLEVSDIIGMSDLYEKPGKEQHAYCMDIDRKGDIRVLANVHADENWTGTMLHELGHAVYDRYIDAGLPFVLREHAHVFTTEAIAMLFGRLSKNPAWIQSMIGIDDAERKAITVSAAGQQRLAQLVFARWCQVMVRFERLLYEDPEQDLNAAWWDLVQRYQFVTPPEGRDEPDWAAKIHVVSAPVYYHNYMLGELLASQLDHYIQERFPGPQGTGNALTGDRAVGDYLRENVFIHGRRYTWNEMIERATGEPINPEYFVSQFVR
jgi:peptidyl-dipeptidase A